MSGTCLGRVQTINKECCEGNTSVSVLKLQMMYRSGKEFINKVIIIERKHLAITNLINVYLAPPFVYGAYVLLISGF